jgi:twitching motility protein PilT
VRWIEPYLKALREGDATGLLLKAGEPPLWRLVGGLVASGDPLPGAEAFHRLLLDLTAEAGCLERFRESGEVRFALPGPGGRFRVQVFREEGGGALALAPLPDRVPLPDRLGLPPEVRQAAGLPSGLVVLAGPPASGRTTTLLSLLEAINESQARYIVGIDEEAEFVLPSRRSLVHQVQVGTGAATAAVALAAASAAGADVLALGAPPRDAATMRAVLRAAEAGALVLVVADGHGVADALDRLLDLLPPEDEALLRSCLAARLQVAAWQTLVSVRGGGTAPVLELVPGIAAVQDLIRERRLAELQPLFDDRRLKGLRSLEQSLAERVQAGELGLDAALRLARQRARLDHVATR